ncbi:MAG: ATP-binding protein [Frankiaceae bacterium]
MAGLRVRVLGRFDVDGVPAPRLGSRKGRTLLKILALARGQPVPVDLLVDALWPESPPARPAEQVAVLVSRLRTAAGADIARTDAGYALRVDWLDVDAAAGLADEAERRLDAGALAAARSAAAAALALLRGPLLPEDPDAEWAEADRAAAQRLAAHTAHTAAKAALVAGETTAAAELAGRVLDSDPYDEAALRLVMRAQAAAGRPASALAAYARFRQRLAEDLGVDPAPQTTALHTALLQRDAGTKASAAVPAGPPPAAPPPTLAGRDDALAALDAALAAARCGVGTLMSVVGEAGIGKTALLAAWAARAREAGALILPARCDELGRSLPLQPIVDAVDRLVGELPPEEADSLLGPDEQVLGPLLASSTRSAAGERLTALTDPGAGQALLFAAAFSLLRRQAARRPVVLLIDDAHLAGPATLAWLRQAPVRLATAPVVTVAAQRAEERLPLKAETTIELGPLSRTDAAHIVGEDRVDELYARSGGNPLFLAELGAAAPGALPASIRQAVDERCARAGPAAATLRTAAVIGPQVDLDLLAAVTGVPAAELLDHLEEGVRRRILTEEGATFAFRHALVREAVATTASGSRQAYIHRTAGRALQARSDADPLAVAQHARLGGDRELAAAALLGAARLALRRYAQDEAVSALDEAIALHDTAEARLERARIYSMLGRLEEADADVTAARARGESGEYLDEVAAWVAHFARRFDEARALADRGAQEATDPEVRVSCLALAGWSSLAGGAIGTAEQRLTAALAESQSGAAASAQLPSVWLGFLRLNQGRSDEALRLVRPGAGQGLATHRFPNGYSGMAAALSLGMLGRAEEALAALDVLDRDIARMGARRWPTRSANIRGWVLRNLGADAEADDANVQGVELGLAVALDEGVANGELDLATGRLLAGDFDAAAAHLDRADRTSERPHAFGWRHQLRARLLRARLALAVGQPGTAEEIASSLAADTATLGTVRYETQARLLAAQAVAAQVAGRARSVCDLDELAALLDRLPQLAGLEAWWLTGEVAEAFDVDRWRALARRRAGELATRAGERAETLQRAAMRRLG